jgi:ParB-like chromosome segregation protein Spo0J
MTLPLAPDEVRDLITSTSTHQQTRRLSPMDVALLFRKALDGGASKSDCAEAVGFADATMVGRFLRLLDLAPRIQAMIDWGSSDASLSFTSGTELAHLPVEDQEELAPEALRHGLRTGEIKAIVQRLRRSDVSPAQALEEVLKSRPHIEQRHVFVGKFGDPATTAALSATTEDERQALLNALVRDLFGESPIAVRLTPTGFVVTAAEKLAVAMRADKDFEAAIEKAIVRRMTNEPSVPD